MNEQRIPVGEAVALVLHKVTGDLKIEAGAGTDILLVCDEEVTPTRDDDEIRLTCRGNCGLTMPAGLGLRFERVVGNVVITDISAEIEGKQISGDLRLSRTGAAQVGAVGGDASAADCTSDLQILAVGGDLSVESLAGNLSAGVGGELKVSGAQGTLVAHAGGNARLDYATVAGGVHVVQSGGNIECRLPPDVDATLNLQYGGSLRVGDPRVRNPGQGHLSRLVLGSGDNAVYFMAGGNITLRDGVTGDTVSDAESRDVYTQYVEENVQNLAGDLEAQLSAMASQLDEQMGGLAYGDEIAAKIQERMRKVMAKAEAKIERAMQKAERNAARQSARVENRAAKKRAAGQRGPSTSQSARRKRDTGDEERAAVLRMLEQGKITVDQADRLLSAMEA
jgi:hypothetical protein